MTIIYDDSLSEFEFWQGGAVHAAAFTSEQMDRLERMLTPDYPHGIRKDELNDLFWFHEDELARDLGFLDFEDLKEHNTREGLI